MTRIRSSFWKQFLSHCRMMSEFTGVELDTASIDEVLGAKCRAGFEQKLIYCRALPPALM